MIRDRKAIHAKSKIFRLFLESDVLHEDAVKSAEDDALNTWEDMGVEITSRPFFDHVEGFAWHDLSKTWELVKRADEIYADSYLFPLSGGSYIGAPVIMDGMCKRAVEEGLTGKAVYLLRPINDILWSYCDVPIIKKAFKKGANFLFTQETDSNHNYSFQQVNFKLIKK